MTARDPRFPSIGADAGFAFGAYRLLASRVTVHAVVGRFRAGESVTAIAEDYYIEPAKVEECLRWRLARLPYSPPQERLAAAPDKSLTRAFKALLPEAKR